MSQPDRPPFPVSVLRGLLSKLRLPWSRPGEDSGETGGQPPGPNKGDEARERVRAQIRVVRDAFGDSVAIAPSDGTGPPEDDADAAYLYRPGHLLVRADRLEEVMEFLASNQDTYRGQPERVAEPVEGLVLLSLPPRTDGRDEVLATLTDLDEAFPPEPDNREAAAYDRPEEQDPDRWPVATPDHLLYVTAPSGHLCPATEPEEPGTSRPFPRPSADQGAGKGVRVSVVDTGLWVDATESAATPWMAGVDADQEDEEHINQAAIHPYGGHGTFVAGVVRCLAPGSEVDVEGVLTQGGAVYESEICRQLDEAITENKPQLISLSAGTHTRNSLPMLAFLLLARKHGLDGRAATPLVVAAAGNDASTDKFWPAAFAWVVGVGSVDPDEKVSDFSNYGEWVKVWARGRDIVNAFPEGTYTCYEPPNVGQVRHFKGMAQWSGTSFSTPIVTGLIAAHMSATGNLTDPRRAYDELISGATPCADPKAGGAPLLGPLT